MPNSFELRTLKTTRNHTAPCKVGRDLFARETCFFCTEFLWVAKPMRPYAICDITQRRAMRHHTALCSARAHSTMQCEITQRRAMWDVTYLCMRHDSVLPTSSFAQDHTRSDIAVEEIFLTLVSRNARLSKRAASQS